MNEDEAVGEVVSVNDDGTAEVRLFDFPPVDASFSITVHPPHRGAPFMHAHDRDEQGRLGHAKPTKSDLAMKRAKAAFVRAMALDLGKSRLPRRLE